ncbi:hydrophobic protein [Phragmitibacter flavus]|uniref:Hydrophobic protein n=1 Tax=Phragmitibacter flavus TaxID=2576071 RepID=A0A5R8KC13_9BACT|nr:hydrophobic protein [Phragmitibacter flavus]TLD69854.1 hydrophobic protein [Phragmitibacter flavus]
MKNSLPGIAVILLVIWLVAKVVFAVTGFFLNLLWMAAVLMFVVWLFGKFFGKSTAN